MVVFRNVHNFAAMQAAVASCCLVETFSISERILTSLQQLQPLTDDLKQHGRLRETREVKVTSEGLHELFDRNMIAGPKRRPVELHP
jgi:hypothetical protein